MCSSFECVNHWVTIHIFTTFGLKSCFTSLRFYQRHGEHGPVCCHHPVSRQSLLFQRSCNRFCQGCSGPASEESLSVILCAALGRVGSSSDILLFFPLLPVALFLPCLFKRQGFFEARLRPSFFSVTLSVGISGHVAVTNTMLRIPKFLFLA